MKRAWEYQEDETSTGVMFTVYNEQGKRITESYCSQDEVRLIAAAPDMAAVLKRILNSDMAMLAEDEGRISLDLDLARNVLAKAGVL